MLRDHVLLRGRHMTAAIDGWPDRSAHDTYMAVGTD